MSVIQLVGPSTGTAQPYLASVIAHLESLELPTTVAEALAEQAETLHGTHRSGTVREGERVWTFLDLLDDNGTRWLMNMAVPDDEVQLWQVPLTSPGTASITATRGVLTVPAKDGVAIVTARTPRMNISGHEAPPVAEDAPDAPVAADWEQRTPGVANGYALAEFVMKDGARWYQTLDLPLNEANNGGSYFVPGTLNSGWVMAYDEGVEPDWTPDTQYLAGRVVQRPTNGQRYRALVDEYAQVGREPENPGMWAVWEDIGAIDGWEEPEEPGGPAAWQAGVAVAVNDEITYGGRLYRVLQAHTTQAGWTPPAVPALFQDIGPTP